ncbi:unnamed protein product [Peniophora sp. CBMAI 1063]|nr:unnamed protein product [Peniophora sp. CBMAI 1063]
MNRKGRRKLANAPLNRINLLIQYANPPTVPPPESAASESLVSEPTSSTGPSRSSTSTPAPDDAAAETVLPQSLLDIRAALRLARSTQQPSVDSDAGLSTSTQVGVEYNPDGSRRARTVTRLPEDAGLAADCTSRASDGANPNDPRSVVVTNEDGEEEDESVWVEVERGPPAGATMDSEPAFGVNTNDADADPSAKRHKSTRAKRDPMEDFVHYRDILLREMLRHEGLKDEELHPETNMPTCACGLEASLKCVDCLEYGLQCSECMVAAHASRPLHRIQIWNGEYYAPYSLERAGLCIQLGHDGAPCPHPEEKNTLLTVIDVSGIHRVRYALCGCLILNSSDPPVQMMRAGWWPSSIARPRTVVTFSTLRLYHALAIQGRINMYDFYNGIVRITDGAGLLKISICYNAFGRAVRMYRNLRAAKRAGRGQSERPLNQTKVGEIALRCPACPIPGVNLPEGWEKASPEERFLYALFLAIDANFKLKLKDKLARSVSLADGWSFIVEDLPYKEHLATNTDMTEMKHCTSEYNALRSANMPASKRWSVNGVGASICARHLLYRAQGVTDLPRGERYACMDYGLFRMLGLTAPDLKTFYLSYDIVCEWCVNFFHRLAELYPELYTLSDDVIINFVIPKFHLEVHGDMCKACFDLNKTHGAARTCAEGIEAGWADMNAAGIFTREMSAANRHECLDDFMQAINWRKIKNMASSFLTALKEALPLSVVQARRFAKMSKTIPPAVTVEWTARVRAWDEIKDKKGAKEKSPYRLPVRSRSLAEVKLEIAKEEAEELSKGVSLNDMTASSFITAVLALEDQKYNLDTKAAKKYQTDHAKASLQVKQNQLYLRAKKLESAQSSYIIGIGAANVSQPDKPTDETSTSTTNGAENSSSLSPEAGSRSGDASGSPAIGGRGRGRGGNGGRGGGRGRGHGRTNRGPNRKRGRSGSVGAEASSNSVTSSATVDLPLPVHDVHGSTGGGDAVENEGEALRVTEEVEVDDNDDNWIDFIEVPDYLAPMRIDNIRVQGRGKAKKAVASAENAVTLWLPSNLASDMRSKVCNGDLVNKEIKFRIAVCNDQIHNVRRAVRTVEAFYSCSNKVGFLTQRHQTRNQTALKSMVENLNRHVERYRRSWNALCVLDPQNSHGWQASLKELTKKDLRTPEDDELPTTVPDSDDELAQAAAAATRAIRARDKRKRKTREGDKSISWIWLVNKADARDMPEADPNAPEREVYEYMRIDWMKARCRSLRWAEQVRLLLEEMRRVVWTHADTAVIWERRAADVDGRVDLREDFKRGAKAHALRQANVWLSLGVGCVQKWEPFLRKHKRAIDYPARIRKEAAIVMDLEEDDDTQTATTAPTDDTARTIAEQRAATLSAVLRSLLDGHSDGLSDSSSEEGDEIEGGDGVDRDDDDIEELTLVTSDEGEDDD